MIVFSLVAVSPPLLKDPLMGALPNKPVHLGLSQTKKKPSSQESNPNSPNVTITPAEEEPKKLFIDSGNNSMTNSDHSGNSADNFSGSPLINFDSSIAAVPKERLSLAEFDPLIIAETAVTIRSSVSHDSLLFDPYRPQSGDNVVGSAHFLPASPTPTPSQNVGGVHCPSLKPSLSTSPRSSQSSPRGSLTLEPVATPPSIVRPRPRGRSDPPDPLHFTTSAPSSRSQSPKLSRACPSSPTGSIKSQQYYPTWDNDARPPYRSDSTSDIDDDKDFPEFSPEGRGDDLLRRLILDFTTFIDQND